MSSVQDRDVETGVLIDNDNSLVERQERVLNSISSCLYRLFEAKRYFLQTLFFSSFKKEAEVLLFHVSLLPLNFTITVKHVTMFLCLPCHKKAHQIMSQCIVVFVIKLMQLSCVHKAMQASRKLLLSDLDPLKKGNETIV